MRKGSSLVVMALLALALALAVSACGRRGQLERPTAANATTTSGQTAQATLPEKPDRPFILDGLLR